MNKYVVSQNRYKCSLLINYDCQDENTQLYWTLEKCEAAHEMWSQFPIDPTGPFIFE